MAADADANANAAMSGESDVVGGVEAGAEDGGGEGGGEGGAVIDVGADPTAKFTAQIATDAEEMWPFLCEARHRFLNLVKHEYWEELHTGKVGEKACMLLLEANARVQVRFVSSLRCSSVSLRPAPARCGAACVLYALRCADNIDVAAPRASPFDSDSLQCSLKLVSLSADPITQDKVATFPAYPRSVGDRVNSRLALWPVVEDLMTHPCLRSLDGVLSRVKFVKGLVHMRTFAVYVD